MDSVGIALVGCGGMGVRHAEAYAEMRTAGVREVRLVGVFDPNRARAAAVGAEYAKKTGLAVTTFQSMDDVLSATSVDAVDIVVPTGVHHIVVTEALQQGKHVLVEKPLAITVRACRHITSVAARTGLVVAVAENFRRTPANRALQWVLREAL